MKSLETEELEFLEDELEDALSNETAEVEVPLILRTNDDRETFFY